MKRKLSSALLLSLTVLSVGCAKLSEEKKKEVQQEQDAILQKKHLEDAYTFRNSDTNEVVETESDGTLHDQKYTYLTGSAVKWSGPIKWWYNPAGQPSFLTTNDAVNAMINATNQWSQVCGVTFSYQGLTTNTVNMSSCNGATVVGWGVLSGSTVGYTQACFSNNIFGEFDMTLDNEQPLQINSVSMLHDTAIHEFGHAFGLGHTDVSPAVMTAFLTTGSPVPDDIAGCQSLYGPPATSTPTTTLPPPTTTTTTVPASTSGWTYCANEGGYCSFSGTRTVRYGAGSTYYTKTATGGIACDNNTFGDPVYGTAKHCDFSSSTTTVTTTTLPPPTTTTTTTVPASTGWTFCANEWGTCSFSGTRSVRYGAGSTYVTKTATGSIACDNNTFGDPLPGTVKHCDFSNSTTSTPTTTTTSAAVALHTRLNYGYCLDSNGSVNSTQSHLWQCYAGIANQSFTFTAAGEIRVNGKCLDASTGRAGDPLVVYDCTGGANQKWTYNSTTGEIKGINGLCMDVFGATSAYNGANVGMWTCNGGNNQKWDKSAP